MIDPGCGEAWTCARCQRLVLGEGSWGISPSALCTCGDARQPVRPLPPSAVSSTGTAPNAARSRPPSSPIDRGEALAEALRKIAAQEHSADMSVDEQLDGDFEDAYNTMGDIARAALAAYAEAKGESR